MYNLYLHIYISYIYHISLNWNCGHCIALHLPMLKILSCSSCWDSQQPFFLGCRFVHHISLGKQIPQMIPGEAWISQPWTLTLVFSPRHTSFMTSMILNRQLVQLLDLEAFSSCPKSAASGKKKRDECCWDRKQVLLVKFWIVDNAGGKGHPTEITVEKAAPSTKTGRFHVFCLAHLAQTLGMSMD